MNLTQAIMATVHYHDIFNYPLTKKELLNYLIVIKSNENGLNLQLKKLVKKYALQEKNGYYFLKNRLNIIKTRQARFKYSKLKLKTAQKYAQILRLIPTVQFVGISGALAMQNSTKSDDIDFVIITGKNWLWTTRFLVNVLLFPVKRNPGSKITNDRACLNLFLDESDLRIKDENIYQAHEICQLKPIWQRNNAYYRFIKANSWVKKYLPNWVPNVEGLALSEVEGLKSKAAKNKNHKTLVLSRLALVVENFAKNFQINYMKRKISTEQIGETQLFFHPANTQEWVLREYEQRLKKYKLF